MTPQTIAMAMLYCLIGDDEWVTPRGLPAYRYFEGLEIVEAAKAYREIADLNPGDRMGDIIYRMEREIAGMD